MTKSTQPPASNQATLAGRTVRYIADLNGQGHGIAITVNGITTHYWVDVLVPDFGTAAFSLEKCDSNDEADNVTHDILIDGRCSSCTCMDHLYRGNKRFCKHIAACVALVKAGKIVPAVRS